MLLRSGGGVSGGRVRGRRGGWGGRRGASAREGRVGASGDGGRGARGGGSRTGRKARYGGTRRTAIASALATTLAPRTTNASRVPPSALIARSTTKTDIARAVRRATTNHGSGDVIGARRKKARMESEGASTGRRGGERRGARRGGTREARRGGRFRGERGRRRALLDLIRWNSARSESRARRLRHSTRGRAKDALCPSSPTLLPIPLTRVLTNRTSLSASSPPILIRSSQPRPPPLLRPSPSPFRSAPLQNGQILRTDLRPSLRHLRPRSHRLVGPDWRRSVRGVG